MVRFLAQIGNRAPYRMIEMDASERAKQAVLAGPGFAFISRHSVIEELRLRRHAGSFFLDLQIVRQWFLLHRAASLMRSIPASTPPPHLWPG